MRFAARATFSIDVGLWLGRFCRVRRSLGRLAQKVPNFTVRRYADDACSDNPTYLAQRARILEGMRLAGVPEG